MVTEAQALVEYYAGTTTGSRLECSEGQMSRGEKGKGTEGGNYRGARMGNRGGGRAKEEAVSC